jgi:hypothetical protein
MKEMKKIILFAISLLILTLGIQAVKVTNAQSSSATSEHFVFNDKLYAFWGSVTLCSFEAIAGSKIVFNLSTTGDGTYGVGYEAIYSVIGNSQGSFFNYSAYPPYENPAGLANFSQTVPLAKDDSYNITIAKHPFFTTVSYFGTIDVYGPEKTNNGSSSTAFASFGPLGNFNVTSPTNTTYNSNILNLNVTGKVIVGSNVRLILNYSLDGQEPIHLPLQTNPAHPEDPFIGAINASVILSDLSEGSHSIAVFGDLEANGPHLAQATIFFTVNNQPLDTSTPSPTPVSYTSPTQQPTIEPTQTASPNAEPNNGLESSLIIIGISIIISVTVAGVLVYLKKHKRQKREAKKTDFSNFPTKAAPFLARIVISYII